MGWLGFVLVISCLGKGTIMKGTREFRRQVNKRKVAKPEKRE